MKRTWDTTDDFAETLVQQICGFGARLPESHAAKLWPYWCMYPLDKASPTRPLRFIALCFNTSPWGFIPASQLVQTLNRHISLKQQTERRRETVTVEQNVG